MKDVSCEYPSSEINLCISADVQGKRASNIYTDESENKVTLLLIDPQNDFITSTGEGLQEKTPNLIVPHAKEDMDTVVRLIEESFQDNGSKISEVVVTLDTHKINHIGHSKFWENRAGEHPEPQRKNFHYEVKHNLWKPVSSSLEVRF